MWQLVKWLRLYDDLVFNAKAQALPPRLFKHWIGLLCLASRNEPRGYLPSLERIGFALRMKPSRVSVVLQMLFDRGFIEKDNLIHDWNALQRESDDSAIRKQAQRDRQLRRNVTGQSHGKTASDTDTEQRQIQNRTDKDMPTAEKRGGVPDPAFEHFKAKHQELTGTAYVGKTGDFVQLSRLRKANNLESKGTPEKWEDAVLNYFASPLSHYSITDLCAKFPVFRNSPVDEYRKPVNHGGNNGHKSKTDRNREATQSLLSKLDQQDRQREQRGNTGSDVGGLPGDVFAAKPRAD